MTVTMAPAGTTAGSLDDLDPLDFALPDDELRRIFAEKVVPLLFGGKRPDADAPVLLLGGVPGSGKSTLFGKLRERYPCDFVVLDRDWFRQFQEHPQAKEWIAKDPLAMPYVTEEVAGALLRMAVDHALEHGYGLVVENSLRTGYPLAVVDKAAAHGRAVHLGIMAVPHWQSRLDATTRFLLPGQADARWTQHDSHEKCIPEVPKTLAELEKRPNVGRIDISDRTRFPYSAARGPDGAWPGGPGAVAAYQAAAGREPTPQEARDWLNRYWTNTALAVDRGRLTATTRPRFALLHRDADALARRAYGGEHEARALRHHRAAQRVAGYVLEASEAGVPARLLPAAPALFLRGDEALAGLADDPSLDPALRAAAMPYIVRERLRRTQITPEQARVEESVRREATAHLRTAAQTVRSFARTDFPRPVSAAGSRPAADRTAAARQDRQDRRRQLMRRGQPGRRPTA
ncbi:zeta toxin family protein [Nocardiopsis sediminis]|uniref:UDP-N-acetylglucosamine kinase n=1 Tax=Nocardiopsis sediminis TaxID=1778267 RepID=A0ABV8FPG4_9ACTN